MLGQDREELPGYNGHLLGCCVVRGGKEGDRVGRYTARLQMGTALTVFWKSTAAESMIMENVRRCNCHINRL